MTHLSIKFILQFSSSDCKSVNAKYKFSPNLQCVRALKILRFIFTGAMDSDSRILIFTAF